MRRLLDWFLKVSGDGFRCRPIVAADFRLGQPALGLKQRLLEQ
jgi:hypothetical protein